MEHGCRCNLPAVLHTMRRLLLALATLVLIPALHAEHLPGGTLSYTCQGGGFYEFRLLLWRECSGAAMIPQQLKFQNTCGTQFVISNLTPTSVEEVSPLCEPQLPNSTCSGGPLVGLQAYTYLRSVFLSPCELWIVSWSVCCRNGSLNLQNEPGLYIETQLNNVVESCNSSPRFTEAGIPFACVGQAVSYDAGVVEDDGHRLRYRFIDARFAAPEPTVVNYVFPIFGGEPWPGMTVDSLSGNISFTPTQQGYIVVVVEVNEFNEQGQWLGSVMRDFPFVVTACDNTTPNAASGFIVGVNGTGSQSAPRGYRACSNGTVCMQALFTDPNAGQSLSFSSNADIVLPGATFSVSGTNPATLTICWDATDAVPGLRSFLITAMDDACPVVGMQNYTYTVLVEDAPFAGLDGNATACLLTPPFNLFDSLAGDPPTDGVWRGPDGMVRPATFNPAVDVAGDYTYTVSSFAGCSSSATVTVEILPEDEQECILLGLPELPQIKLQLAPNPSSGTLFLQTWPALPGTGILLHLLDLQGRELAPLLAQPQGEGSRIELPPGIADGSYLLRLQLPDGQLRALRFQLMR